MDENNLGVVMEPVTRALDTMTSVPGAYAVLLVVLVGGVIVGKLCELMRIPDVAGYLLLGIAVGPYGLHLLHESTTSLANQFILTLGATLILFDGGRGIRFRVLRKVWLTIGLLATVGVMATVLVVAAVAWRLTGLPLVTCLLMASVIASTDPATLIPVFKQVRIEDRVQQTVESESAFNDATASILTITLLAAATGSTVMTVSDAVWAFLNSALGGLAVGVALGLIAAMLVSQCKLGVFHEFGSVVMLIAALLSYFVANQLGASGYMAVFAAGVMTGNSQSLGLPVGAHTFDNIKHFGNVTGLVLRMLIFVLLGSQVDFSILRTNFTVALLIVIALIIIARPLTVLICALPDRRAKWRRNELLFMFWVRETGVIPAALSGMLIGLHVPYAKVIGAVTFMAILITVVVQASTTGIVARKLGLVSDDDPHEEY